MNALQHTWRVYAIPGAVFQSLMVGGGYGTGRNLVEDFSCFGVVGGYLGLSLTAIYFAAETSRSGQAIVEQVARVEMRSGWALSAFRYCLYSSVVIPAMLFATRAIQQRREAIVSGVISAAMGVLPAVLLHTTFAAG